MSGPGTPAPAARFPGPLEVDVRRILANRLDDPFTKAILLLAAELDRRPGAHRSVDPAGARTA